MEPGFERLCREWEPKKGTFEDKKSDIYQAFKKIHADDFRDGVNLLINDPERFSKFPSTGEIWKFIKRIQKEPREKTYPECKACDPRGIVSIVFGYELKQDEITGEWKDVVVERHYDTSPRHKSTEGIRYYTYALACRCERGRDRANQMESASITPREYEELLND